MVIQRQWDDAIHLKPVEFKKFWPQRLEGRRDILVICGLGWDPRMTALLSTLKNFGGQGLRHLHLVNYRPSPSFRSSKKDLIEKNLQELEKLLKNWMEKKEIDIITRTGDNRYVGDGEISKYYTGCDISRYTDILVDINALPKSLYFTLLLILVKKCNQMNQGINLHVIACQDVALDNRITESVDDTRFLKGFEGGMRRHSQMNIPKVWAPVLARNCTSVVEKLHDNLQPHDIYPVMPFPSRNPRIDDDLLMEYQGIFVDGWRLNPLNIIYAAEDEPLDIYRSLLNLYYQQMEALKPLGGISMAFSCLSSKLASIGAFMAAYEKKVAVAHAIGHHDLKAKKVDEYWSEDHKLLFKNNLHSIWLTGEPYE